MAKGSSVADPLPPTMAAQAEEIARLKAELEVERKKARVAEPEKKVWPRTLLGQCNCDECCEMDNAGNVIVALLPHPIHETQRVEQRKSGQIRHWWCHKCNNRSRKGVPYAYAKEKPTMTRMKRTDNPKVLLRMDYCRECIDPTMSETV